MSCEAMEVTVNIADWYASPSGTIIRLFGKAKPPHVLPRYATDKLITREVSYHLATWLPVGLQRKKKEPWPSLC